MDDDPKPFDPGLPPQESPADGDGRHVTDDEGPAFDPEAVPVRDETPGTTAPESEDSAISHASRVLIGTGRSGIDAASDMVPEASSVGTGPRFLEDVEGGVAAPGAPAEAEAPDADADEWHDVAAATHDPVASESIGFGTFLASHEGGEQGGILDSSTGDSQGVGESTGPALDFQATASVPRAERRGSSRRDAGPGQIVGVVLGGVLAIPVTLAILLWGFQRDPLGVVAGIPEPLRFLLPQKFRAAPPRRTASAPIAAHGLDAIAAEASRVGVSVTPSPPPAAAPIETVEPHDPPSETEHPVSALQPTAAVATLDSAEIPVDVPAVDAAMSGPDFAAVDAAVARALAATDGIVAPAGSRDAALVAWYQELAEAARESAAAERRAMDAGTPTEAVVARIDPLARRLLSEHVGLLEDLGAMWLSSVRRPSDGVVLAATLDEARAVGPWWGGRLSVRGDTPRSVTFLGGTAIRAMPGERLLVAGVLVDPGTMWVVAAWPAPADAAAAESAPARAADGPTAEPTPSAPSDPSAVDGG